MTTRAVAMSTDSYGQSKSMDKRLSALGKPRPRVWHLKETGLPDDVVRVDRGTKWGNPFRIGNYHPQQPGRIMLREDVIALHRAAWNTPEKRAEIRRELRGKDLACWCAPNACHADFYLEVANDDAY